MLTALSRYIATRSLADARKVRAYDRKHPMAASAIPPGYRDVLADAIFHANSEIDPRTYRAA